MLKQLIWATLIVASMATGSRAEDEEFEINTQLMETTFQLLGPGAKTSGETASGTAFIMEKPIGDSSAHVLITAAHVLDDISGDRATLMYRSRNENGTYSEQPYEFPIRQNGKPLYVKHPSVDVAALYMRMPASFAKIRPLPAGLLIEDGDLKKFEIHPGDELLCLGYPLFAAGQYGYPILRSGKLASYPLVPSKEARNWLLDFRILPGNSGGPVYFVDRNRDYAGGSHLGETIQFLAGLVTAQANSGVYKDKDLSLGIIIPAVFIRETLDMLPAKSPYR